MSCVGPSKSSPNPLSAKHGCCGLRQSLSTHVKDLRCEIITLFGQRGEVTASPGHLAQSRWNPQAVSVMSEMLLTMTPPISVQVHVDNALSIVQRYIAADDQDQDAQKRLTERDLLDKSVQLYCLSYRHEPGSEKHREKRITSHRLSKVLEVVRDHAATNGHDCYSIWIDSLKLNHRTDHVADWADRGLPPYAFCYVVLSPGPSGFEHDAKRTWIACEHQLAANSRGILYHKDDQPPKWTNGWERNRTQGKFIMVHGGGMDPLYSLRGLAMAVCSGLIDDTQNYHESDRANLKRWAAKVVCTKWPRFQHVTLPLETGARTPPRPNRAKNILFNLAGLHYWGTFRRFWDITGEIAMNRDEKEARPWHNGRAVIQAVLGSVTLVEDDGKNECLNGHVSKKSQAYVVHCKDAGRDFIRGLVVFEWAFLFADPILVDVDLETGRDLKKSVKGFRVIHNSGVRKAFSGWNRCRTPLGEMVNEKDARKPLNELLTHYYERYWSHWGIEGISGTDTSDWFVGKSTDPLPARGLPAREQQPQAASEESPGMLAGDGV